MMNWTKTLGALGMVAALATGALTTKPRPSRPT